MDYRLIKRNEIVKLREIARKEIIENVFKVIEGELILKKQPYIMDWSKARYEEVIVELQDLYDREGTIIGAFNDKVLVGIVSLENKFIGKDNDQLQITMLQVSNPYRSMGIGGKLIELIKNRASDLGAKKLYISSSCSEDTVYFYLSRGSILASEIDKNLFELEPEDIHLELKVGKQ